MPSHITLVTLHSKCNHSNNVECLFERSVLYSTMGGFWGFEIMGWVSSCVYVLTGMYASLPNFWRCLCTSIIHNTYLQIFLQRLYLTLHMHSAEMIGSMKSYTLRNSYFVYLCLINIYPSHFEIGKDQAIWHFIVYWNCRLNKEPPYWHDVVNWW